MAGRSMQALSADDPATIGGYRLLSRLGEGGFGVVYLGLAASGRAFAVKVLRSELARDSDFLARFRREVAAARKVSGVYTAPVVTAGLEELPPWVATAFVAGPSLAQFVAGYGPLPEPALWRLLAGLTDALEAIHAAGIVHRDLKPANILLAADGPKVIDFGISRALDLTAMTRTGSVMGTPLFMPPEQARAQDAGPPSDVFSLGGVLTYAATGRPPFGGGDPGAVLYRVVHDEAALDGIPAALREVIAGCLAKAPAARPSLDSLTRRAVAHRGDGDGAGAGAVLPGAAFWPRDIAALIRAHQDRVDEESGGQLPATLAAPPLVPAARPSDAKEEAAAEHTLTQQAAPAGEPSAATTRTAPEPPRRPPGSQRQRKPAEPYRPVTPYQTVPAAPYQPAPATPQQPAYPPGGYPAPYPAGYPGYPAWPGGYQPVTAAAARARLQQPWSYLPGVMKAAIVLLRAGVPVNLACYVLLAVAAFESDAGSSASSGSGFQLAQISDDVASVSVGAVLVVLLTVLWTSKTRALRRGQRGARTFGSVCFLLYAAYLIYALVSVSGHPGQAGAGLVVLALLVPGVLALAIVVLLWLPPASQFLLTSGGTSPRQETWASRLAGRGRRA